MNLGMGELILVLAIVLIIFGAGKLPQIGDALGRSIRNFKRASNAPDTEIDVTPGSEPSLPGKEASTSRSTGRDPADVRRT